METFRINLQSQGLMPIGEATAHRPSGVQQPGSVLVVVDGNRGVSPAAVYWAIRKVVSKGDHLKILGIITHIPNLLGFMVRVDQSTRNSPNIMELQFEIATKKEAIWRTPYVRDWCEKAGVKLEVDVKAGNNSNVIASDEARAMGAFYVILDKNMKKDRKHFVDSLSCVVSRMRSTGGVETLRSFAMTNTNTNKLPPMAPSTPKNTAANTAEHSHQSMAPSVASTSSYRGSSMSSTTFELAMAMGGDSSDDLSAHETDPVAIPLEASPPQLTIRNNPLYPVLDGDPGVATHNELPPRGRDGDNDKTKNGNRGYSNGNRGYSSNNVLNLNGKDGGFNKNSSSRLCKLPVGRKAGWNEEDIQGHAELGEIKELQQPGPSSSATARAEFRNEQGQVQRFIRQGPVKMGQLNVSLAPEFAGKVSMGRAALTASLQTQASFNNGRRRQYSRPDKVTMDMHWPLMHWADSRAFKLRVQRNASSALMSSSSNSSLSNFRGRPRRVPVGSALNYSDMVDSD